LRRPASSRGVIGIPSAENQPGVASQRIAFGVLAAPGMSKPASPWSGASDAPKKACTYVQKLVLPIELRLIEPSGSATPS
jgi:hypothetical protein